MGMTVRRGGLQAPAPRSSGSPLETVTSNRSAPLPGGGVEAVLDPQSGFYTDDVGAFLLHPQIVQDS